MEWNLLPAKRRKNHTSPPTVLADMAEHVASGGNLALATDAGYIALDFDTPDAVTRAKAACKAWKCSPPYATTAHGIHMLFRLPTGFQLMASPNKSGESAPDLGAGLRADIRAFGAAIVVWPSVHAGCERLKPDKPREDCHRDYACAGAPYRWRRALPADPADVPLLPDAWLDAVEEGAGDGPALEYTRDGTVLVLSSSNRTRICTGHLDLRAIIETPDKGDLREFVVRPVNGRGRTIVMLATGDQVAEPKAMRKLFARAGSYRWFGSDPELDALAMLEDSRPRYLSLDHCGRLDGTRAIALGTGVYSGGALLEIPDTGRVTIPDAGPDGADGGDLGVQLRGAEVGGDLASLPRVRTTGTADSVAKVADVMYEAWGVEGLLALAWSCVAPCAVEFRARYPGAGFPLLWITGERGSGKTALASVACQVWGMQVQQGAQTTPNALVRLLGFYAGLPVALDDARPKSLAKMIETILGATTGTGGTRADAADMRGVHRMRARAVAAVISESAPSDPAAASRSMVLALSRTSHDARTRSAIHSLHAIAPAVGHHVALVLTGDVADLDEQPRQPLEQSGVFRRPELSGDGFAAVQRFARWADEVLLSAGLEDSRQRGDVWAPAIAGIHLLGLCSAELNVNPWLEEATAFAVAAELAVRASDWVVEFLADVSDMAHANRLMGGVARYARTETDADLKVNVLWLNLSTLVGEWLRERRSQGREAFVSLLDLRGYLEAKPYCWHAEGTSRKYHRLGVEGHRGQPVSCWGVLLEREDTPPGATAIALQLGDPNIAQSSGAEPPPNF